MFKLKKLLNCFPRWLCHFTFPPAVYEVSYIYTWSVFISCQSDEHLFFFFFFLMYSCYFGPRHWLSSSDTSEVCLGYPPTSGRPRTPEFVWKIPSSLSRECFILTFIIKKIKIKMLLTVWEKHCPGLTWVDVTNSWCILYLEMRRNLRWESQEMIGYS